MNVCIILNICVYIHKCTYIYTRVDRFLYMYMYIHTCIWPGQLSGVKCPTQNGGVVRGELLGRELSVEMSCTLEMCRLQDMENWRKCN